MTNVKHEDLQPIKSTVLFSPWLGGEGCCVLLANDSLLGRLCSLLPVQLALRDLGHSWLACCPHSKLQTGMHGAFGSSRVQWPGSTLAKLQCPSAPRYRTRSVWLQPSRGPSSSFFCQKVHISKEQIFTNFNVDEFEDMVAEKRLILGDYGVKESPVMAPGTNARPCTHEGLGSVPFLLMPTSRPTFLSKTKEWRRTCHSDPQTLE